MQKAVVSVSTAPRGAIISQWLVKAQESASQGHASEEEEDEEEAEQKEWCEDRG